MKKSDSYKKQATKILAYYFSTMGDKFLDSNMRSEIEAVVDYIVAAAVETMIEKILEANKRV